MSFKSSLQITTKKLGFGQFGEVYEGYEPPHGKVAVKILKKDSKETINDWATRSNQLLSEAEHLKNASHPNVVQVLSLARDATTDVVHMAVEFCDGGSVDQPYRKGPISLHHVKKIVTDAARGLEHIHNCGMIHRDIKPGNILKHGTTYKIGDFGLVTDQLMLSYASLAGYISHLAPEALKDSVTSRRTDVWALGMTAYRLTHGHDFYLEKFDGKDIEAMILDGGFAQSFDWLPHIPDDWRRFIRKAMHDDSSRRFQSAHEMGQAVGILGTEPRWLCTFAANNVVWKAQHGDRNVTVTWTVHSPRKHQWEAIYSGGGKPDRKVAGTKGQVISRIEAKRGLEEYFARFD